MRYIQEPKISAKSLLYNNWYVIKLIFKAYPLGASICALEKFRLSIFVFLEHTWLVNYVLESIQQKRPFSNVATAIILVTLGIAISTIIDALAWRRFWPKLMMKAKTALKNTVFDKAKNIDLEQFDNPEYYNDFVLTVERTEMIVNRTWWMVMSITESIGGILTTGVFFLLNNYVAFFIVLMSSVINLFFSLRRTKLWYKKSVAAQPHYRRADYTKRLFYLIDYAKEIRLNPSCKKQNFDRYDQSYSGLIGTLKKYNKKIIKVTFYASIISLILMYIVLTLWLAYQASVLGTISFATVVVLINSAYRLQGNFESLVTRISDTAESCMYMDKIRSFLSKEDKIKSTDNLEVTNEPKKIELKNVSFKYTQDGNDVLSDISMTINAKEKIALVGYNGAGKTTLIKLIMRLYDPTNGEILQNGVNINKFDVEKYRKHIGVIFQDFNIYAATVKENVVMDISDDIDSKSVVTSLNSSGFSEKLSELKDGIETQLTTEFDDLGVNLSGGESQKVAVSRAFLQKAGLIILDEPSSALDPIAEYNLNKYMLNAAKDSSVIFISHRLSTTRIADKIYMLENGRIVESGSHEQLLKQNGKYAQMWHTQASSYLD